MLSKAFIESVFLGSILTVSVLLQPPGKFLYFSYGSNLLAQRIHINNPSAVRAGIARLKDYRLDFGNYSHLWNGYAATIIPKNGSEVWGALWEIENVHLESLDRQEGVADNNYRPLMVEVEKPDGTVVRCRTYQQTAVFDATERIEDIPAVRRPSVVYKKVILKGAEESGLSEHYIKFLQRIPDNGYDGETPVKIRF